MANIAKLLVSLGIDVSEYGSGLDAAGRDTSNFVDKLTSNVAPAIGAAFAGGAAAAAAFAVTSVNAAGDFEAGMNEFASVTGTSIGDAGLTLDDFQGKFLELGAVTAFSAAQAQQAAIELAKGGVPIIDVMNGATDATLSLAAAGSIDLAEAAGIVAKQLGVWGNTGVEAANVADLMAQAANASTVDVDELALGMANVGGAAKVAGVSFQETVQTMAMISGGFSSASDAGTSLKTFLSRLQPTTGAATAAMVELGLATADGQSKFYDATGSFIGMDAAAQLLHDSTAGLSEAEKSMALQTIFGSDALRAAAIIAEQGAAGFANTGAAMTAAGTAAEQAAIRNQGFKFAIDSLFGSIETLQIIVGGALLPTLTNLVNTALIPAVNVVTALATAFTSGAIPIAAVTNLLTGAGISMGDTIQLTTELAKIFGVDLATQIIHAMGAIGGIVGAIQPLIGLISGNLMPILIGVAAVVGGVVVVALYSMIAAFLAVAAPIAAAIAVAGAMYVAYQNNFFGIRDAVNSVMNAVMSIITSVASGIQSFWAAHGAAITTQAIQTWNIIYTTISQVVALVRSIIVTVFGAIMSFITDNSATITGVLLNAWNLITGIFQGAATIIQGVVTMLFGILHGDFTEFASGAATVVTGLINTLHTIFSSGLGLLQGIVNLALELVRDVLNHFAGDAGSLGRNIIDGIINGVKSGVGALISAVRDAATRALDAAKSALGIHSPSRVAAAEIGVPFVQGINAGIDSMIGSLRATAGGAANVLADSVNTGTPQYRAPDVTGTAAEAYAASAANGGAQYNITAQYKTVQDERTLRDDLRLHSLVNSPSAG